MGLFQVQRLLYRYETCFSHRIPSLKPLAFRFTLSSVTKITSPGVVLIGIAIFWVSGIKEDYKGLLNGDILVGVK